MIQKSFKILMLILFCVFIVSCQKNDAKKTESSVQKHEEVKYYTCPMHPEVHEAHPGHCPICGMELVPVFQENSSQPNSNSSPAQSQPTSQLKQSSQTFTLNTLQINNSHFETEKLKKKDIQQQILLNARVVFDPEFLLAAQENRLLSQYSFLGQEATRKTLLKANKEKLALLGLSETELKILNQEKISTVKDAAHSDWLWAEAQLSPEYLTWVKEKQKLKWSLMNSDEEFESTVSSVKNFIDSNTRSAQIRFRVQNKNKMLKPEMLLKVKIENEKTQVLAIHQDAVMRTGNQNIAFVVQSPGKIEMRKVKLGIQTSDDVEIVEGLNEGEEVIKNNAFLLLSEAKLQGIRN